MFVYIVVGNITKIGEYTHYITSKICGTGLVDAIVTNHPHCILPYKFIGDTLITYGLGNFIFSPDEWTRNDVLCEYSILLNAHIDTQNKKIDGWTFSIVKNEKIENGIMKPINIFDLKEKSQMNLSEIRKVFKRFGYSTKNIQILKEYNLS